MTLCTLHGTLSKAEVNQADFVLRKLQEKVNATEEELSFELHLLDILLNRTFTSVEEELPSPDASNTTCKQ
jgi:hypothetical protein